MQPVIDVRAASRTVESTPPLNATTTRAPSAGGGPRSSAARTRATSGSACEPSTTSESSQDTRGPRLRKATPAYICRNTP